VMFMMQASEAVCRKLKNPSLLNNLKGYRKFIDTLNPLKHIDLFKTL